MEKSQTSRKQNKEKLQKESHSEIERKRRERMKLETEFLHRQVPHSQCKDKLSIFLAGAERLIHYGSMFILYLCSTILKIFIYLDKLGKREYIINDEEYSRIIMNTINGFAIHVRCSDGEILHEENVLKVLDIPQANFVGQTLYDVAEPSSNTKRIIRDSLMFYGSEMQQAKDGELIPRNFVIAMRCGPSVPLKNCVRGSDGQLYRFIEFCGDIVYQRNNEFCDFFALFRGVCRPLDMACPTVFDNVQLENQTNQTEKYGSPIKSVSSADHVTLRIGSNDLGITEVVGNSSSILGWTAKDLLNRHIEDFVTIPEQSIVKHAIQETIGNGSSTAYITWLNCEKTCPVYLQAFFTAIKINNCLYCIVCKLYPSSESTSSSWCKAEPQSPIFKHSNYSNLQLPDSQSISSLKWNKPYNYSTPRTNSNELTTGLHFSGGNTSVCVSEALAREIDNYSKLSNPNIENHFDAFSTSYKSAQPSEDERNTSTRTVANNQTYFPSTKCPDSKDPQPNQCPVFTVDTDEIITGEIDQTLDSSNRTNDMEYNNNNPDGEDWRQLPLNTSFSNMLPEGGLPELLNPDYIKDLIKEDITDL
ncbi:unnamed protein product [Trichobilharzia szidati]|nr:unnamed protein product [Trichobilharzia szidati]